MDALDWNKTYDVLSISRLYLKTLGFPVELIKTLTDEDMEQIANILIAEHLDHDFDEDVKFVVRLFLEEKRKDDKQNP